VEAQEAEREVAAMLRHLDHPAPPLDVESIEVAAEPTIALRGVAGLDAASGRGTRTSTLRLVRVVPGDFEDEGRGRAARGSSARAARKGIRRGVIALACTAAAAAAAVPGSPVRHAIGHLISPRPVPASRAAPVPAAGVPRARPAQLSPAVRGVAIAAGGISRSSFARPTGAGSFAFIPA